MGAAEATRYFTFLILNLIIATCGSTLWAFGAILQVHERKGIRNFNDLSIGGFAIGVGVLIFLIAIWGGWAAFKRKPSVLTSYAALILIMFIIQIVLGAIALGSTNHAKCELDKDLAHAVRDVFSKTDDESWRVINRVQKTYKCCGYDGPKWWNHHRKPIPASCCQNQEQPCERPFEDGCAELYTKAIERNVNIIGGVAIGFAITELIAGILAWYIRLSLNKFEYA